MSEIKSVYIENVKYCVDNGINKLIMFIKDEKSILEVKSYLEGNEIEIELIAITFPANEKMYVLDEDDELSEFVPGAADGNKIRCILKENKIPLVSSALPFEGIVIPGDNFNPYKIIEQTLNMVNPGLPNLVQALLVATDSGLVVPKERVLVMNAGLAIDVLSTNTRFLFHPEEGMQINKVIHIYK
ncbi:hypothetical protein [Sporosarcina limicola]|uniref:Uncharacterized protein n=1 Tax=Sporosarcina limicola TaxID=34101 RepID=A0A927R5W8_9BACL|nr:hypothetical protein [Sporosarcina limicola]MBE1556533.1 hypothetical protein [Sporosarcina limicola]